MRLVDYKTYFDAKNGVQKDLSWKEATELFAKPKAEADIGICTAGEDTKEYKEWKSEVDKLKKRAGYVFWGETKNNSKKKEDIINHSAVALDYDGIEDGKAFLNKVDTVLSSYNYMYYSTTKSTDDLLRIRIVIPLDRPSSNDEFQALARECIRLLGTDGIDSTSIEDNRAMGYTVLLKGQKYIYKSVTDKADLPVESFLNEKLPNWKDASTWFYLPNEVKETKTFKNRVKASRAMDEFVAPTELSGYVGAFCRAYSISKAFEKFLPDVYIPFADNRYTYRYGSSQGGVQVFDDRAANSYHSTDPAHIHKCHNAFQFVQAHLYGELPEKQAKQKMLELAKNDAEVIAEKNRLVPLEMEIPEICNNWLDFVNYPENDWGIAKRLNDLYNGRIGWATDAKVWMLFNGIKWEDIEASELYGFFEEIASIMRALSAGVKNADDVKTISKIVSYVQTTYSRDSALKALKPMVAMKKGDMDYDNYGMNTPSGYLRLRDNEYLTKNSPDLHCRKVAGGGFTEDFTPDEKCLNFLKTIIPQEDVNHWLHKWFGYCLTGSYAEKKLLFLYGKRNNGKSALISLASEAFGDYYQIGDEKMLLSTKYGAEGGSDNPTPSIAKLAGTRLCLIDEMPLGRRLDTSAIKRMTGGVGLSGRELRQSPFNFKAKFKIVVACNDVPALQDANDSAMRMRVRIVPFTRIFDAKTADKSIEDKVKTQAWKDTFIWWCFEGLKYYQAEGLDNYTGESSVDESNLPDLMKKSMKDYFEESDDVGEFINTYCEVTDNQSDFVPYNRLYELYIQEQKSSSYAMSKKLFGSLVKRWMQEHNCLEGRKYVTHVAGQNATQQRGYYGIRFYD